MIYIYIYIKIWCLLSNLGTCYWYSGNFYNRSDHLRKKIILDPLQCVGILLVVENVTGVYAKQREKNFKYKTVFGGRFRARAIQIFADRLRRSSLQWGPASGENNLATGEKEAQRQAAVFNLSSNPIRRGSWSSLSTQPAGKALQLNAAF